MSKESFVPGKYVLAWQAPVNGGGDPNCCGYDWQICNLEDTDCKTPVDSGTTRVTGASTSKVTWGDTYNVMVRANNVYGVGPWAAAQLTAGGGTLQSIVFGQTVDNSGKVIVPLSTSSSNIEIWAGVTQQATVNQLIATLTLTQLRNGKTVYTTNFRMSSQLNNNLPVFLGTANNITIQMNDVFKAYIYIQKPNGDAFTDGQGTIQISGSKPGPVTGIMWGYIPFGSPDAPSPEDLHCKQSIQLIMNSISGQGGTVKNGSYMAGLYMNNNFPADPNGYRTCNAQQRGMIKAFAMARPPNDITRTCVQAIPDTAKILNGPEEQCGAAQAYDFLKTTKDTFWVSGCSYSQWKC